MSVRTIERRPLRADVTRDLTARIVAGELPAGTRLRDTALAAEMGVSRTPVREALVTLSHSGWLEADAGKGFTVAPLRIDDVMNGYPIVWTLERLALTLCPPFTSPALDVLTELNAEFLGADMSPLDRIALDDSWHRALLES